MAWKFDPQKLQIVWTQGLEVIQETGTIDLAANGDITLDLGSRENTSSLIDGGLRVIDGTV